MHSWSADASPSRSRLHPFSDAALIIGIGAVCAAAVEAALLLEQKPPPPWVAALVPVVALIYVAVGIGAWLRRPNSRLALLIVAGGGAWFLAGLANVGVAQLTAAGLVMQTLPLAVIVHLLIGFPTGRLRDRSERLVVVAGYFVCLVLQAPLYLFAPGGPLSVADRPELAEAGFDLQRIAGSLVVLATAALMIGRMRDSSREKRRVLAPLTVYGIFALLFVPVSKAIADSLFDGGGLTLPAIQFGVLALVPVAFVVAASRGGFERNGDLAELGAWLGADEGGRPALRDALVGTLGDPSLQLLYGLPGSDVLVDDRGIEVPRPGSNDRRAAVDVELAGGTIGAIVYDPVVLDRPAEVREAGRVIALALDRQRLTVELRASRSRIAAAADDERRRIARDLHDGLQSRLVFLAVQAGSGSEPEALRVGIESAIDELRELVDGVMPAQLTERGLPAAVTSLADRLPIPIAIEVAGLEDRLAPEVETAAYFVVSEAIVNAVKHAEPESLEVLLDRADGRLRIEVADDGAGGAHPAGGIRGITDRVEALGGGISFESEHGRGTRVEAVIPCAS
jgi:signal transduction histidine kinase